MRALRTLIEQQIARARARGELSGLKGEGKPLPVRRAETAQEAAVSAGYRMMAEAGVVPEEFRIKAELDAARGALQDADSPERHRAAQALVADLELRYNIAVEARRKFMS